MQNIVPILHMDEQGMWRWYLTSGGVALAVSLRSLPAGGDSKFQRRAEDG